MSNPPAVPNIALYTGGDPTSPNISQLFGDIEASTYSTAILWAAHVNAEGNISMNDDPIAVNGQFLQSAMPWATLVTKLRLATINRIELSIGGDQTSFANIQNLIEQFGIGSDNPLYQNLQILQQVLTLDAVNYDDESQYDSHSSLQLAQMCINLKMKVTICPYTYASYWVDLVKQINAASPNTVDAIYLQCYSGGGSNDPVTWAQNFSSTGLSIVPGLWATHVSHGSCTQSSTAKQVQSQMAAWQQEAMGQQLSLAGGFIFCGTDVLSCPNGGSLADYSNAIQTGISQTDLRIAV